MAAALPIPVDQSLDLAFRVAQDVPEDAEAFCALSNTLYSRQVKSAYYRWQFFQTPFPTVLVFATVHDGQLAGCYGIQVRDSSMGRRSVAMALDIMVAPPFQGRGLFRKLAEYAQAQVLPYRPALIYVMANERADAAHVKGLGWQRIQVLNDAVRSTAGAAAHLTGSVVGTAIQSFSAADGDFLSQIAPRNGAEKAVRLARGARDLQWRLLDNPRYAYQVIRCTASDQCVGFLVLKVFCDPVTGAVYGDIIDVIQRGDDRAIVSDMLALALG